jgi:hypothetical protein
MRSPRDETFLDAGSADGQLAHVPQPSAPPGDAWEMLLARYPGEVQVAVHQVVKGTSLGVADALWALVITTCQPKTTPQPPHECSGA